MSLKLYRKPRIVALNRQSSALEAARAIESNNIGAIVIQEKGQIAGILTDRDLAVRVVGRGLDPRNTTVSDVMSSPVITLSVNDSQQDAIGIMQDKNIRRIPLVEQQRFVGMVTLDDLLLDEAAPLDQLAAIVQTQLGEGGPAPSPRLPSMRRRTARAESTYGRFLNQIYTDAAFETADQAEAALHVVLKSSIKRLTPGEAKDLIAQLPSLLQPMLRSLPPGPDKLITKATMESELTAELGVDAGRASQIVEIIGKTISQNISRGQIKDLRSQLPEDLRAIFSEIESSAA